MDEKEQLLQSAENSEAVVMRLDRSSQKRLGIKCYDKELLELSKGKVVFVRNFCIIG